MTRATRAAVGYASSPLRGKVARRAGSSRHATRKFRGTNLEALAFAAAQYYLVAVRQVCRICPPWAFPPQTRAAPAMRRPPFLAATRSHPLVQRDDAGAAEAEVVLKGVLDAVDLRRFGGSAQLAGQLPALGEARRAEWMALGKQSARRVGDDLAAVGVVAGFDERLGPALGAEPERLVSDQLVLGEAVVQLDDFDILGPDAGLLVDIVRRGARHVVTDQSHHVVGVEGRIRVRRHRLRGDGHLRLDAATLRERLGDQNGGGC